MMTRTLRQPREGLVFLALFAWLLFVGSANAQEATEVAGWDFEDEQLDGWAAGAGVATMELSGEQAQGSFAAKLVKEAGQLEVNFQNSSVADLGVQQGDTVMFRVWLSQEHLDAVNGFQGFWKDGESWEWNDSWIGKADVVGGSWSTLKFTIGEVVDPLQEIGLQLLLASGNEDVAAVLYIDDVAVIRPGEPPVSIAEARAAGADATVTVEGVVTRAMGAFTYLQDETGGLTIRQTSGAFFDAVADGTIGPGTELSITGTLGEYASLLQINGGDLESYEVLGTADVPAPQIVTIDEIVTNGEAYESELIRVIQLTTDSSGTFAEATSYVVATAAADTTTVLRIPNEEDSAVDGMDIPEDLFMFTGVVGQYNWDDAAAGYQLLPIAEGDVATGSLLTIAEARAAGADATVTVEGVVTRAMGAFTYLQDETGGLTIRQTSGAFFDAVADGTIGPGTELSITGTLGEYASLLQINGGDLESYEVLGTTDVPAPQVVSLRTLNESGEAYEAELVEVAGLDTDSTGTFAEATSYFVTDGDTTIALRIPNEEDSAVDGMDVPGGTFGFTGVIGQYNWDDAAAGYQLLPVAETDVWLPPEPASLAFGFESLAPLNFWVNTSSDPGLELSRSDQAVEGDSSLQFAYNFAADQDWGGSADIQYAPEGGLEDLSSHTGVSLFYQTTDPISEETGVSFAIKLVDNSTGVNEFWEYRTQAVITDETGAWQELKVPFESFVLPSWATQGNGELNLDAIAHWEMQVVVGSEGIGNTYVGSFLLDDLEPYSVGNAVDGEQPLRFALRQNYPNPFNPSTTIEYELDAGSHVTLAVYNVLGQQVAVLVDKQQAAGRYTTRFDARGLASGLYVYRIEAGDKVQTRRMVLVK